MPGLLYLFLLLYGKYYTYNRTFVADVKSVGCEISFTEIENDSILAFSFSRKGENKKVTTLFVHNRAWDVLSLIFTKDSIFVRDLMEFHELFPPEEKDKHIMPPKDYMKGKVIKDKLPLTCRIIPYSDSRFFVYDDNKHRYVQIDSTIHIIKLSHFVERANDYHLFDENIKDTIEIHLDEIKKK